MDRRYLYAIELALFRMTQELVNNTVKYANATEVQISIFTVTNEILLEYSDNGIGFDPKKVKKGLGLRNLEGRSTKFGGSFQINTDNDKGFSATIRIPIQEPIQK